MKWTSCSTRLRLERRGAWEEAISLYEQAVDKWGEQPEAVYAKNAVARLHEMQGTHPGRLSRRRTRVYGRRALLAKCGLIVASE